MPSKKSNFYLTREQLITEIILSKKRHREANFPLTVSECMTPKLTEYLQLMVHRYANKGQWRGYSYIEDMKSDATLTLCQNWIKFDEIKYDNPFGYYTQIIKYCFITFLEKEELMRDIKDSLWESIGMTPSYARQIKNEMMKDVADQSNKGLKALKRDTEAINLRVTTLSSIITRINRLESPDLDLDFEISEVLEIDPKPYTGDLEATIELFVNPPIYEIEPGVEVAGQPVICLTLYDQATHSNTKRVIPDTEPSTIVMALCSIGLTIRRDLMVKRLRDMSGYNIISTRMPTADKINDPDGEADHSNETTYNNDIGNPAPKRRIRRKTTD